VEFERSMGGQDDELDDEVWCEVINT
jgi:hypothetical protein